MFLGRMSTFWEDFSSFSSFKRLLPKFSTISLMAVHDVKITSRVSSKRSFRGHSIITPSLDKKHSKQSAFSTTQYFTVCPPKNNLYNIYAGYILKSKHKNVAAKFSNSKFVYSNTAINGHARVQMVQNIWGTFYVNYILCLYWT